MCLHDFYILTRRITHLCSGQILLSSNLCLDQMITMNCGGHSHPRQATADELEHCHLGRSILHGHTVRMQTQVSAAPVNILIVGVSKVTIHDLLR